MKYKSGVRKSWNKGEKTNIETRKKQSESMKEAYREGRKKSWNKGKKASEETRRKQSIGIKKNPPKTVFKKGQKPHNWKSGYLTETGYKLVLRPNHPYTNNNGYVKEHRLIMENYLGRYLLPEERVHHLNGIKTDNRIKNLKLFPNESEHQKFHNQVKT